MDSAAKSKWISQAERLLEARDYLRAIDVIGEAKKEFPGDAELDQLETRAWRGLGGAPEPTRTDIRAARPEKTLEALQEEYARDSRNPTVRGALVAALAERAKALLEATPGDAEELLRQAAGIDPANPQVQSMLSSIEDRRRERLVEGCLYQARWLESQGDVAGARRALETGLKRYPNDARLLELRDSLQVAPQPVKPPEPPPVKAAEPEPAKPKQPEPVKAVGVETGIRPSSTAMPWDEPAAAAALPPAARVPTPPPAPAPGAAQPPAKAVEPPKPAQPRQPAVWAQPKIWVGVGAVAVTLLLIGGVVKLVSGRKAPAVATPATPQQAVLEVTTSPPGALVVVDGKESGTALGTLQLPLNAGSVQVEARLPGYQPARATANLQAGVHSPLTLTLSPVVALRFFLPGDGKVAVNDEPPVPVEGGSFSRELPVGTYSVKITSGQTGSLSFAFQVDSTGLAVLTAPPTTRDVAGLLISNFGDHGRIYTTGAPVKIKLDGQALGELTKNGLDFPKLTAGTHELELGENQDLRKKSADFGAARTLTAIIDSDPNTGTLVVQANEDGATITVLSGKKQIARGPIKNGRFRVSNLRAATYVVTAAKDGFDVDTGEQPAAIQKGQDKTVAFTFRQKPQTGLARVHLTPGSELFADGSPVPGATGETYTVRDLKPGTHTFRAQKGKQFLPMQKAIDIVAGQTSDVDLRLAAAAIPVEIKRSPAESTVTYTRAGDPTVHTFTGNRQELSEGDYTFTARAKGYLETVQELHIGFDFTGPLDLSEAAVKPPPPQALTMADWGSGLWTETPGWYVRKTGGIILFPKPLGTGVIEFTVHWKGKGRVQWVLNAGGDSYLLCELTDDEFQIFRVAGGKKPAPIGTKKRLQKMGAYSIRIEVKPDGITHKVQRNNAWEALDTLMEPAVPGGKFGFDILNGQEIYLANFTMQPER